MLKLIYLISILLLCYSTTTISKQSLLKRSSPIKNQGQAFYQAAQTGDKSALKHQNKKLLKKFGVIHLLTPSGIHLSAILGLILFFLPRKFHIYLFCGILFYFTKFPELYSLKRVLYFQIILFLLKGKRIDLAFVLTFIFDLISGGFIKSPLSFSYSFLFWGTIMFSNKGKLVYSLFLAQLIALFFSSGELNLLSSIVNPILTSIYSFCFPLMSLNFWILKAATITKFFFEFHESILMVLKTIDSATTFLLIKKSTILLFIPFMRMKPRIVLCLSLFYSAALNNPQLKEKESSYLYSLASEEEIIRSKMNRIEFLEVKCIKKFKGEYWNFLCKKKPSKYGGPIF